MKILKKAHIERNTSSNRTILRSALKQLKPSSLRFKMELKILNYDTIAKEVEMAPEICKDQLKKLIEPVSKTKCLSQILREAIDELSNRRHDRRKINRKPTYFSFFVAKNSAAIDEAVKKCKGRKKLEIAADLWNKLTDAEKMSFGEEKVVGKTPFDLFYESRKEKHPETSMKEFRSKWKDLAAKKKFKYIQSAVRILVDVEDLENRKNIKYLSKQEINLYIEHVGMPRRPSNAISVFFIKESDAAENENITNFLNEGQKRFSKLSVEEQCYWRAKYEKAVRNYPKTLEHWKEVQDKQTLYVFQLYQEIEEAKSKQGKSASKKKVKCLNDFNTVEMPVTASMVKFKGQPAVPPLRLHQLYKQKLEKETGKSFNYSAVLKMIRELSLFEKKSLLLKTEEIRASYIERLKTFANSLTIDQRKLYLGLNRINLIKSLQEDIFEKDYPDNVYPVFVKIGSSVLGKRTTNNSENQNKAKRLKVVVDVKSEVEEISDELKSQVLYGYVEQGLRKHKSYKKEKIKTPKTIKETVKHINEETDEKFECWSDATDIGDTPALNELKVDGEMECGEYFYDDNVEMKYASACKKTSKRSGSPRRLTSKKLLHSTTSIEMASDSDEDIENDLDQRRTAGICVENYMNFLKFRNDDIKKDEAESSEEE